MPGDGQAAGPVRTQAADGVLTIVLDRPRANAVDVATSHALYDAFASLEADASLRAGIVTGPATASSAPAGI